MPEHLDFKSLEIIEKPKPKLSNLVRFLLIFCGFLLLLFFTLILYVKELSEPTSNFPINTPVVIESGTGVKAISEELKRANVVKSDWLLYYVLAFFYEPKDIKASTYVFEEPLSTFEIAKRLTEGDFDTDLVRFTHFEGERANQLAKRAAELLTNFDEDRFILAAEAVEGRLFPDTYFVPADFTDEDLLKLMQNTFSEKLATLQEDIDKHNLSLDEILILASIIEREANAPESMKLVSSVLQNRLEIGMALQADASIEYILDKPLAELMPEDLKIDSPYNTYLYTGLPPTPIGNPGLDSIMAVLEPTTSDYFYYITDDEGVFHYAKTYREHLMNIEKYLR